MYSNADRTSTYGWNIIDANGHSVGYLTDSDFQASTLPTGWVAYPLAVAGLV